MGQIADALKKAEQERQQLQGEPNAPLESVVDIPPELLRASLPGNASYAAGAPSAPPESRILTPGMDDALVSYYQRTSMISEQYRSLRARLMSQNPRNEHRSIAITSSVPGEGKSVTTANLGFCMAEVRQLRILVVDADLRRGSLASMLKLDFAPGLAFYLQGKATFDEVVQSTPVRNLSFVGAGDLSGLTATELLSEPSAVEFFRLALDRFHYVLVDTPPASRVSDVAIIGQLCTAALFVVRLNKTPEGVCLRSIRMLQDNNIPVLGCLAVGDDNSAGNYHAPARDAQAYGLSGHAMGGNRTRS